MDTVIAIAIGIILGSALWYVFIRPRQNRAHQERMEDIRRNGRAVRYIAELEATTKADEERIFELAQQLEQVREALSFYADEDNWTQPTSWGERLYDDEAPGPRDCGKVARAALTPDEEGNNG